MKTSHVAIGVAAAAALVAGGVVVRNHYKAKGLLTGGTTQPKLIPDGKGGTVPYDVAKWHVVAVMSPTGTTVLPGATGPAASFAQGDYVTFLLGYEKVPSDKNNPAGMAVGQITQMGEATGGGKKQGLVRFVQMTGQGNPAFTKDLPTPDPGTPFSVTSDDVASVVPPEQVPALLGAA